MTDHIVFQDPVVEDICLNHWDINRDRQLSINEAQAVTELGTAFTRNPLIRHFPELRFFTGLQAIDISAFDECTALETISLPVTIKVIAERAFQTTPKLEHITLPQHLQSIGFWSFADSGLRSLYLPADVKELAIHAFSGCKQLTTVTVSPDNPVFDSRDNSNAIIHTSTNIIVSGGIAATVAPTVIGFSDEALCGTDRSDFVLPAHIRYIGHWSLNFFVRRVYCMSPVPPAYDSQNGSDVLFFYHGEAPEPTIYVPYGSLEAYQQAEGWSYHASTIIEFPARPVSTPFYIIPLQLPSIPVFEP